MSTVDVIRSRDLSDYIEGLIPCSDGTMRMACPLHGGTNPTSFTVFPDNTWFCFSCNKGGDIINYVMESKGLCYDDAVQQLAEDFNLPLDEQWKKEVSLVQKLERQCKSYESHRSQVVDYLHKRGFSDEVIETYRLGYNPNSHCLMIPLINNFGRMVGFTARHLDDTMPKYLHSKTFEKSKFWFNFYRAKDRVRKTKRLFVVEGHLDAISLDMMGEAAIAYMGIRPSREQIGILKKNFQRFPEIEIVILIDNDGKACQHVPQVRTMFTRDWNDANVRIAVTNTDGVKDANDMLVNGVKISDLEMDSIDMFTLKYMLSISTNLEQEYRQSQQFCRQVNNEMIKSDIAEFLAKRWAKPVEEVRKYLDVPRDTKDELIAKQHDIFDCLADYEALCESEGKGIGWLPLDETMDGCRAREVLVLSGYTSAGKSTLALKTVAHRIIRYGDNVLYFSLEMPRGAVIESLACEIIGINQFKLKEWRNDSTKNLEIYNKIIEVIGSHLRVVDEGVSCMEDVWKHTDIAKEYTFDRGVDYVVIDHFHLFKGVDDNQIAAQQANIMQDYVKHFNLTLLVLAQFNESSQQRTSSGKWQEPTPRSIKGSNELKSIAASIILCWRVYYSRLDLSDLERDEQKYDTIIKLAKHRRGVKKGIYFRLKYDPETTRMNCVPLT